MRPWIEKAEDDFLVAEKLYAQGPADPVCFHAQQCVEKYVKAILTLHGIDFPKTHDLARLIALMPDPGAACLSAAEQDRLTDYATATRCPGDYDPITLEEAQAAVEIARRVREGLRLLLLVQAPAE